MRNYHNLPNDQKHFVATSQVQVPPVLPIKISLVHRSGEVSHEAKKNIYIYIYIYSFFLPSHKGRGGRGRKEERGIEQVNYTEGQKAPSTVRKFN